jgi:hypothetical protein
MRTKTRIALLAAGIISLVALGAPNLAGANERSRSKKLGQAAQRELGRDSAELQRDRADLRNLYRSGASRGEIYRKQAEIRGDLREIAQDRQQLYGRYDDYRYDRYRHDNRYGYYNRGNRNDNGWWNWSNWGNWGNRDRWDYRR